MNLNTWNAQRRPAQPLPAAPRPPREIAPHVPALVGVPSSTMAPAATLSCSGSKEAPDLLRNRPLLSTARRRATGRAARAAEIRRALWTTDRLPCDCDVAAALHQHPAVRLLTRSHARSPRRENSC